MNMDVILSSFLVSSVTGLTSGLVFFSLLRFHQPKKNKKQKKVRKTEAMNASAMAANSVVDQQKIKTAEIEIPVISEDVLTYDEYELGESYPDITRLYYAADAIKDPEYIETVMRSPLQVRTHDKNTSEYNRGVDGWPSKAWWDPDKKRVMVRGFLHGEENVKYAKENRNLPGFGTSAYISFLEVDREAGIAPNGKPYDAIVRKAVNNHIAILPNIRDPKQAIVAMNAISEKVDVTNPSWVADDATWERAKKAASKGDYDDYYAVVTDIYKKMGGKIESKGANAMPINKDEFKAAMNEYEEDKRKEEEAANRIKNAVINELKTSSPGPTSSGPVTSTATGDNASSGPMTSTATGGKNSPESSGPQTSTGTSTGTGTASNAIPSEEMIADFSRHLGVTLQNPTLAYLGSLVGIKSSETSELIGALNAKREEFKKGRSSEAMNGDVTKNFNDLMNEI